jgi:hypothetical protein
VLSGTNASGMFNCTALPKDGNPIKEEVASKAPNNILELTFFISTSSILFYFKLNLV